jgi:DNA-binding GntR family transcriptional regulator
MPDWSGISRGLDVWVHEQIARRIEEAIASGEFPPGSRIPPQKRMADEAGVSEHTVGAAVALLRDRGIVRTKPRLGTFVTERASE